MSQTSTISRLVGRAPKQIPVKMIRPTDVLSRDIRKIAYEPILLVKADDGLYYIVDGNHRFFRKLVFGDYQETIAAWVLEEGDQVRVHGNPLPQYVREWKEGQITLQQLSRMAKAVNQSVEIQIKESQKRNKVLRTPVKPLHAHDPLVLSSSVIRVLRGVTTIEKEAQRVGLTVEQIRIIHKCFIDGGTKAIREKLDSGEF